MRTAILYSPIDPAGEQGPLGTAPSAITPVHILLWALLLPHLARSYIICPHSCHRASSQELPPGVAMTPEHSLGIPRSGPSPVPHSLTLLAASPGP